VLEPVDGISQNKNIKELTLRVIPVIPFRALSWQNDGNIKDGQDSLALAHWRGRSTDGKKIHRDAAGRKQHQLL
jgi:hypothetical protein